MLYILLKIGISAVLIALISEAARRFTAVGAILASLPLTSILAMIWLYRDTADTHKISELSYGIFWMVIPSLLFFLLLPLFLKMNLPFAIALILSCAITAGFYFFYIQILACFGIKL